MLVRRIALKLTLLHIKYGVLNIACTVLLRVLDGTAQVVGAALRLLVKLVKSIAAQFL